MRRIRCVWGLMLGVLLVAGWSVQPVVTKAGTPVSHYQKFFQWQTDIGAISALKWSPTGDVLAATSLDGKIQVWNASDGHALNMMQVYSGPLYSLDWRPDGYGIATGGSDGTIRIWDPRLGIAGCIYNGHGRALSPGEGNPAGVAVVKWSPDGKIIASGGQDGRLMLWAIESNECRLVEPVVIPTQHAYAVSVTDWNAASNQVISTGLWNILPVWDAKTGEKRDEIKCPLPYLDTYPCRFLSADWSADGKYIVAYGEGGESAFNRIWNVATKESRDLMSMCTSQFNWMPKGHGLVGWCDGQLQMFDADTLQMIGTTDIAVGYWEKGQDHLLNAYAISPDEQRIAISYQVGDGMNAIIQIFGVSPNGGG